MASAHDLARGHKQLRALIEFALGEGWKVVRTRGGHLLFTKLGCAPIYTSSTASDHRAERDARAQLRRADRQAQAAEDMASPQESGHG
ncbi:MULTISPECIES: type II toxin-antitoxin system HicA family toxin [Burkholderiaceae]|uniref:Type II toxin-antitoxin system HicA family toxin n=1 Tax=Burkholderia cepacia TaxID=292 RepID=A0A8I1AKD6_BURCE|nr:MULTISPECIES: type II toxin-antitoxin system HicA family toxin [Burkholderiaceae]MBB0025188.1 type II toxin-antitoxin system HicA family toxin [Ralstonia pickettii]MBB0035976.1 type II toxin-antitoxin system HicA family toxin [Ralstonia pickettii]MBB0098516.1 type II toxin-antitoxin system HicA family toxin [Ralstonia pickettii]MBB0108425.1 type II toxin-antitoxin system HicA family toxin [Ralstonia pickettii]MBB0129290.1 type II toxin-antitoxin system HicA family toxin [Ralstonia pickettii